jgi:5-formyltetrahydrofolate cyclo-ligase
MMREEIDKPDMKAKGDPTSPQAEIAVQKRQLRGACRQEREQLGEAARQCASLTICDWLEGWTIFQQAEVILAYMPIPGEVDLTPLLRRQPQKRWVLPRIIPQENHRMVFHAYQPGQLVHHPFGMDEPASNLPVIPCEEVQLALVPGLAFDRLGRRLGYGGGYFDRFLCNFYGVSVGVIFQTLLLERLPCNECDVPVNWIVTERGLMQLNPDGGQDTSQEIA